MVRERPAVLDIAGGPEELLGRVEGRGVDATGEDTPGGRGGQVVRPAQAGDAVEQDHHVMAEFDEAFRAFDGQFRDHGVILGGTVEGGCDHFTGYGALEIGDLFGTLVDENHHEVDLGVVRGYRVRDGLHHHRLAGLGRGDDQASLSLADRGHQVDDAAGQLRVDRLEAKLLLGVEGGQFRELGTLLGLLRIVSVDGVDPHQRVVLLLALTFPGGADGADDHVAPPQPETAHHGQRQVGIVGAGKVPGGAHEGVVVEDIDYPGNSGEHVVLGDRGFVLETIHTTGAAVTAVLAVAVAATPSTAATLVVLLETARPCTGGSEDRGGVGGAGLAECRGKPFPDLLVRRLLGRAIAFLVAFTATPVAA